jgi:hypothetical protein
MGTNLSTVGFTAQVAPVIKRATGQQSDGSAVTIIPDSNIASLGGDDVTGVAKLRVYKSNTTRDVWALNATFTLSPAVSSSTIAAVCSMVLDSANNMHFVYLGIDNSVHYVYSPFSAGTYGAVTNQTVIAANAVTRRFRALDIDVAGTGTSASVSIIGYESNASTGFGWSIRIYCRLNDGTTWIKAFEDLVITNQFILDGSEDVSISFNSAGVVSNVGQMLIFYTRATTTNDYGDLVKEISFNFSTGTALSASLLGTWPIFNQSIASGLRRGWIFKTTSNLWQVAMQIGSVRPRFSVMRLTHGQYGTPTVNSITPGVLGVITAADFRMIPGFQPQVNVSINKYNYIGCVYNDNRVFFGFISQNAPVWVAATAGVNLSFVACGVVFRYDNISTVTTSYNDVSMRPLDNFFAYGNTPIGVYGGGNNRNQASDFKFNFLVLYGYAGNDVTGTFKNKARFALDTFYDAPVITGPTYIQANDTPTLQCRVQNSALYPNVRGKIEFNLALDSAFTSDLRSIAEPDANFRYFGSNSASIPPAIPVSLKLSGVGPQKLYSAKWFMRARVVSDLGQASAWSIPISFTVSHQPTALPRSPQSGSLNEFGSGTLAFAWNFSDTEPTDAQTAYQLVITRNDTGATVYDSTKVTSSVHSTSVALSSSLKDIPLQWSVSLWDSDNVQGPFSNPTLFTVSDSPIVAITSPTGGATVTSATPQVSWSFVGGNGRTQNAFRVTAFRPDVLDLFNRSTSNAWGTSDDGAVWSNDANSAAGYNTTGTAATHTLDAVNTRRRSITGTIYNDVDQQFTVTVPVVALGSYIEVAAVARRLDTNNYYCAGVRFGLTGAMTAFACKKVGGVESDIATQAMTPTYTAASSWNIRMKITGTTIQVKIWSVLVGEPGAWTLTTTDSSLKHVGAVGITSILNTGNTNTLNVVLTYDNYLKFDPTFRSFVGDSGWIQGPIASFTFSTNVLVNTDQYVIEVTTQDSNGMFGSARVPIITSWIHPALGDIGVTLDNFGATIAWTAANIDANFVSWRVYRRYMVPAIPELDTDGTASTWVLIYEATDSTGPYTYKDYLIPLNKSVDYIVVQVADRFGSLIESTLGSFTTVTMSANRYYFIPGVPIGSIASYEANNVSGDDFIDEVEQATLHVIGRGRQVQVGDDLGVQGTLTIQLRNPVTARADREFFQRLASSKITNIYMKNPFGDVVYLKFGSISVKRLAGVGQAELVDLTIPYTEVFNVVPVTRTV